MALFTAAFGELARVVAAGADVPDLPMVVLPHPLNDSPEQEIRDAAREHYDAIVERLTGKGADH